jgi:hypothetical protein
LSEEAKRRLRLADAAMREIWQRNHGHIRGFFVEKKDAEPGKGTLAW